LLAAGYFLGSASLASCNTHANFYNGYKTARKIIETGTSSLSLKGVITDAATGEPLKGVTINFCPECVEPIPKAVAYVMSAAKEKVVLSKKKLLKRVALILSRCLRGCIRLQLKRLVMPTKWQRLLLPMANLQRLTYNSLKNKISPAYQFAGPFFFMLTFI